MRARRVEFLQQGNLWYPVDREFHAKVDKFCKEEMVDPPVLAHYAGAWAVDDGEEIMAVGGVRLVPDVHIRVKHHERSSQAMKTLVDRINDHLADNGYYGKEVLVFKAAQETEEQACPNWDKWLETYGAKPADRYLVTVR